MDFLDVVKKRYACKNYSAKALEKEKLDAILSAGRLAPTAKNLQEQHVYVLQSEKALAAFDSTCPCRYQAPVVLVVAFDKNNVFTYPGGEYSSGIEDATIVATHLILAAANEGVDSCWLNFLDPDALAKALDLPENQEIVCAIDLGYAAEGVGPLANHFLRKDLNETVTYL